MQWLANAGVELQQVRLASSGTGTGVTAILAQPEHRFILTYPGTMFEFSYTDLDLDYIFSARHLHLSSYFLHKALRPHIADLFREARSKGLSTSLDTNDDPEGNWGEDLLAVLPFVDIFFPNEREAKKIARTDDLPEAIAKLAKLCQMIVVKLGARGAVARKGSQEFGREGMRVASVDPVGAGDSFDAGFIHRFLQGGIAPTMSRVRRCRRCVFHHLRRRDGSFQRSSQARTIFSPTFEAALSHLSAAATRRSPLGFIVWSLPKADGP